MAVSHRKKSDASLPDLFNGDQMNQAEFHTAYAQMPPGFKAELLGGIVFEPSPVSYTHGTYHLDLAHLLAEYGRATPGVSAADNVTVILGEEDEVQPDALLRISPESGGRSFLTADDYVSGAPEMVAEVALTSKAIDLHFKKNRYLKCGVLEYLVVCLRPKKFCWFDLQNYKVLSEQPGGVVRSQVFPGLWVDCEAFLEGDHDAVRRVLKQGLHSIEHENFVLELERRRLLS